MAQFTHLDDQNQPGMVDISTKSATQRTATAQAIVRVNESVAAAFQDGEIQSKKGPVFHTAVLGGTMAAKKTPDLIPLCHGLHLEDCDFEIQLDGQEIVITCTTVTTGKTGVEMEAMVGASQAALTIYDMCKSMDKGIVIQEVKLLKKTGGKSDFIAS